MSQGSASPQPTLVVPSNEIEAFYQRHPKKNSASHRWPALLILEVAIIFAIWEALVAAELIRAAFLPPPTAIAASLTHLLAATPFHGGLVYSLSNLGIGLCIAVFVGVVLGVAIGWSRPLGLTLGPLVWILYAVPKVALAPLIILAFGIGPGSKILLVFLLSVFPLLLNTIDGVRTVSPSLVQAGRVFGTRGFGLARKVVLPATFPFILVGLRRGVALGFIGEILGEFLGGNDGIGYLLNRAAADFRMDDALAIVVIMVVVANAGLVLVDAVRRFVAPWFSERALGGL